MAGIPDSIRARQEQRILEIEWPGGPAGRIPYRYLRGHCPCAACVDETTGIRMVYETDVPELVAPSKLDFAGNYALKISWDDGHFTGLYTWDYLASLCRQLADAEASAGGDGAST